MVNMFVWTTENPFEETFLPKTCCLLVCVQKRVTNQSKKCKPKLKNK